MSKALFRGLFVFILFSAVASPAATGCYNYVVAQDGSGDFTTVQAALNAVPTNSTPRTLIFIKNGTYQELVTVAANKTNVTLIGQSVTGVILTYFLDSASINPATGVAYGDGGSASTSIKGAGFYAQAITFQNTAGIAHDPSLAIDITGDKAIFVNCRFTSLDDTIYGDRCRQYFGNCYIEGSTDFVFGPSTAVFESCEMHTLGGTALTAASTETYVTYGDVFLGCTVTAATGVTTDLGRPWRPYAAVSFQGSNLGSCIKAVGWDDWGNTGNEATARFSEFNNASGITPARPAWITLLSAAQSAPYTTLNVLKTTYATAPVTDNWNPYTVINATAAACASGSPTATASRTPTRTLTPTRSATATPSCTATLGAGSPTPSASPTRSSTPALSPTKTPSGTGSVTPSQTRSSTLTLTPVPPSATVTLSSTVTLRAASPTPSPPSASATPAPDTATPIRTASPGASSTATPTALPASATPSTTATAADTGTGTATPARTLTAIPSRTATPSPTPIPSSTATAGPSRTPSASPTQSVTARVAASSTASPTLSPTAVAAIPTSDPTAGKAPLTILALQPVPNPNPVSLRVDLSSGADRVQITIWSVNLRVLVREPLGAYPSGWSTLPLPADFLAQAANGTYFFNVTAQNTGQRAQSRAGKWVILR